MTDMEGIVNMWLLFVGGIVTLYLFSACFFISGSRESLEQLKNRVRDLEGVQNKRE